MIKLCMYCNKLISSERLAILPETEFCIECARIINPRKVREFATCFGMADIEEPVEEPVEELVE